jgi:tripeptide aminopeptidase
MIMALALADVKSSGWFGKVVKGKSQGTSNVGPVTGGEGRPAGDATNVVTDYVHVRGESRSHDGKFFKEITKAYKAAFEKAAKKVTNAQGKSGKIKFKAGQNEAHTIDEWINLDEYDRACALAVQLATMR